MQERNMKFLDPFALTPNYIKNSFYFKSVYYNELLGSVFGIYIIFFGIFDIVKDECARVQKFYVSFLFEGKIVLQNPQIIVF